MEIIYFFIIWLSPCLLGTAITLACLKKRYGYMSFALGTGYLLGLLLTVLLMKIAAYYEFNLRTTYLLLIEWSLALPILFFFRSKRCTIEELRLEKAPSNVVYLFAWVILLLLLLRLSLIGFLAEPLYNDTVFSQTITALQHHDIFGASEKWFLRWQDIMHIDTYGQSATATLPPLFRHLVWLGLGLALMLTVFGGLRYLGAKQMTAMLAIYMLLSLPFVGEYLGKPLPLLLWTTAFYSLSLLLFSMAISLREGRLYLLLIPTLIGVSIHQYLLLLVLAAAVIFMLWHRLDGGSLFLITALLSVVAFAGYWLMPDVTQTQFSEAITDVSKLSDKAYSVLHTVQSTILAGHHWHFLLLASLISLGLLSLHKVRHDYQGLQLIVLAVIMSFLGLAGLLYHGKALDSVAYQQYFNEALLYFSPIFCLAPIAVYHLITKDNDSLPTM